MKRFLSILLTLAMLVSWLPRPIRAETAPAAETITLRYDDHMDMTGKAVRILDAGTPTSYQVGYGVEENAIPDTAVVTLEGDTLVVPMVYPVWKSKEITYSVTEGLDYSYYDLLAQSLQTEGTLTAAGAQGSVSLGPRELTSWYWGFDGSGLVSDTSGGAGENLWNGRSAVFVGDSITAGSGTEKIYYQFLNENLGFGSVTAMGVAGSCISAASDYGQSNQPLINRYQDIPSADLIVIFMGTNDYGHETPLGSPEDTQDGTFYGALNTIIPALVAKHTSSKIVFVTPLHRYGFGTSKILGTQFTSDSIPNGVGATLGDYVDALKTVCANNNVSVIDLYTEYTLDPADAEVRSAYMPDGLHPNAAGHEVIAGIMESHICGFEPTEQEPVEQTEMIYGNKFASGFTQQNRASSRVNLYLKAGTVITLKNPDVFQWACAKTSGENSSDNLGYFPDGGWSDKETAVVAADGWVGFVFKYRDELQTFDLTKPLSEYITIEEPHSHIWENGICTGCGAEEPNPYAGKTIACIGDSITYGVGVTRDETDYVTLLAESLEMDYIRLGASGTTLCTGGHATCNIGKLTESNLAGADVVTILMGINDFVQARNGYYQLGTIDSTDTSTIYGAAHMWCQRIVALRQTDSLKDTEFVFLTPVITSWNNSVSSVRNWDQGKENVHGYTLRDLCNAIIEVCALYDIPVIDLNLVSGLYYNSAEDNTITEFGGDGAHPGTLGHQMMAEAIENRLLQNHLRDDHDHSYGSWITTRYPDCEDGEQQRVCSVCTATEKQKLDGTGHSWENGICTGCGDTLAGKSVSILSHSASTYAGVSNNTAYNSTIGSNDVYYTEGKHGVYLKDTWWQQTIDVLGMRLLVNNSWSGSCVLMPRKGAASVGYGDRAINLHNDHTGEEPDIIFVYLGCNDFAYYKDTFGKAADVDYAALIQDHGDGTFTYSEPQTTCEAYAIMLHKVENRYLNAEIYCMTSTARRDPDYADSYADTGQPTEYSAELQKVAAHFGFPVIDLENCIPKEAEIFDQYMGDKRAHPNALGMDRITNEVLSVMLGSDAEIRHVTSQDHVVAEHAVLLGGSYSAAVELHDGYTLVVTMDGNDISEEVCKDGMIAIEKITGDIEIHTIVQRDPLNFRWELEDSELVSTGGIENPLHKLAGTITNGVLNDGRYELATSVVLKHDLPWELEWRCAENWRGVVLSSDPAQKTEGMYFLSRTNGGQLSFGTWTGSQYDNYGIDLSGMDDQVHTYRLENRISADGSNMVWLYVDGAEIGPMSNYYVGSNSQNATSDWLSGKDFVFAYIGMEGHALRNCKLDYLQVTECVHTYENGICTTCGAAHPNLANYQGKVISVLGDSISTFDGYIPVADGFNLQHLPRYPQDDLLTDVNETWWMQVINGMDAKLGINDSWRGATCSGAHPVTTGTTGENAAMANLTRIQNLGSNGTPDVILFYGGTNDLAHVSKVGTFDPETAPTAADLTTKKWDNLADGFVHTLLRMRHYYPDALIVAMLPTYTASYYSDEKLAQGNAVLAAICEHYGIPYVDLRDSGVTAAHLPDGIHPGEEGMDLITQAVLDTLLSQCEVEPGENVVYSVNHDLTNAAASLGHCKGISAGESFTETLTGENLTVTVTMGGVDITDSAFRDGVISIDSVTGPLHITAQGDKKAAHDGHLQPLPEQICCRSNLWALLEHDTEYYTAGGWGTHASGAVRSVTIPVRPGDQIWATSFQARGSNGGTLDGIRVTWFGQDDVLKSVTNDKVYEEFAANGALTVPEGAVAVNIPMWNSTGDNEVYILSLEHSYENGACAFCGDAEPVPNIRVVNPGSVSFTVRGNVITVTHPTACKVGYRNEAAQSYTAIAASPNGDGSYSFAAPEGVAEVLLVVTGDVNGDGRITMADATRVRAAYNSKVSLTYAQEFAADQDTNGSINMADATAIRAAYNSKKVFSWK